MASDERPDSNARPRFTLRSFFKPTDDPGDGAPPDRDVPSEAFGTGDVDDAALDAIVESADPTSFVWGTEEVPVPVPGLVSPPSGVAEEEPAGGEPASDALDPFEDQRASADEFLSLSTPAETEAQQGRGPAEAEPGDGSGLAAFAAAIDLDEIEADELLETTADDGTATGASADAPERPAQPEPDTAPPDLWAKAETPPAHAEADDTGWDERPTDDLASAETAPDAMPADEVVPFEMPIDDLYADQDLTDESAPEAVAASEHGTDEMAPEESSDDDQPVVAGVLDSTDAIEAEGDDLTTDEASREEPSIVAMEAHEPEAVATEADATNAVATEADELEVVAMEADEPVATELEADEPAVAEPQDAEPATADLEIDEDDRDELGADALSVGQTSPGEPTADTETTDAPEPFEPATSQEDLDEPAPGETAPKEESAGELTTTDPEPDEIPTDYMTTEDIDTEATETDASVTAEESGTDATDGPPDLSEAEATAFVTASIDEAYEDATAAAVAAFAGGEGNLDVEPLGPEDFSADELREVLRTMMLSRKLDDKMLTLLKQGKGFFHIGSSGHEASQVAVAREFEGGSDWFCLYYRDLATALSVGLTPEDVLRAHYGKADDPFGGGRQMPEHFGHRGLNIMSTSSSVGAQFVPAVGFALAVQREDGAAERTRAVYTSGGDGSTSQGAFHEALNWAAREALPVLFHIQDNKFAISVPVEEQTAGGSIWHLLGGYAGLKRLRYDGTDFFESAAAAKAAMDHIRAGLGPVALHADVVRLLPHSSSDDHKKYREAASLAADAARDPIPRLAARLVEAGMLTEGEVEALRVEVAAYVDRIAKEIEREADPAPETATQHVYFEGADTREYELPGEAGDLIVMVDAINHALDEEMARDETVLVYGEDVGGGKGGVFTATRGLTAKHGRDRCFNSPLAEHSILGSAVGLACAGYKPVVEIQFADYIWPGMQPLRNQIASMRYRSNGTWACPMVIRVPAGGYIHGGLCHSQNVEALFSHWPGLHVVMPSNAADAKGLLKAAIRGHDPVLFLEHKALYRQGPARRPEPHDEYLVPLGTAAVTREGTDLTIVTWGAIVYKALAVAKALEKEGVSVEVVDVRSFLPFDSATVLASVRKTGRVLIAYEDHEFMGFGAEIAAQVADAAFGHLDAPVKRVAGAFSSIPYADPLEKAVLPQDADVLVAAREVLAY